MPKVSSWVALLFFILASGTLHAYGIEPNSPDVAYSKQKSDPEPPPPPRTINLATLMALVLKDHPSLKSALYQSEASRHSILIEKFKFLPTLSFEVGYDDNKKVASALTFSEPEPYRLYNYKFNFSFDIFDGFKRESNVKSAITQLEIDQQMYLKDKATLLERLIKTYYDVVMAEVQISHISKTIKKESEQLRIAEKKLQQQQSTKLLIKESELKIQQAMLDEVDWQNKRQSGINKLASMTGTSKGMWEQIDHLAYSAFRPFPIPKFSNILVEMTPPAVKEALLKKRKKVEEIKTERSKYYPTLKATADYGNQDRNGLSNGRIGLHYSMGLSLKWGVDSALLARQNISKKLLEKRSLEEKIRSERFKNREKIQELYWSVRKWDEKVRMNRKVHNLHLDKIILQEKAYQSGLLNTFDLNTSRIQMQDSLKRVALAEVEFKRAVLLLELHMNRKIVPTL